MIKRVNFTGRRRIPRDRITIEVHDGDPRTFDANISLEDLSFIPHAVVILEATCAGSPVIERFEFGHVSNIQSPHDRRLKNVQGENIFFTLKVVDRTDEFGFGRLLGIAEHVRPDKAGKQTASGRRGILPLELVELGQELWKLDFRDHDVHLLVNKDVPELAERMRSDPLFYAAVYPNIVRHILTLAIAENADLEEDDSRWPILWLRFAKNLHPNRTNPPKPEDSEEDRDEWIDEVVRAFCELHTFKEKYVSSIRSDNGGEL